MVSSLAGSRRGGAQVRTGAGPRTTSGVTGPTAKISPPFGLTCRSRLKRAERAVEPAGVDRAGLAEAAFEHVLAVEMRALAIGRGGRVHDRRLLRLIETMQVRHRRIEREERIERQRRRLAVEHERLVAAQLHPIRIADRRHRRQPVERAAQHDREKARIAAFGAREPSADAPRRTARRSRAEARGATVHAGSKPWHHLRWNSGAIKQQRQCLHAAFGLRATAWRVSADASGPSAVSSTVLRVDAVLHASAHRRLAISSRCARPSTQAAASSEKPLGAGGRHSGSPSEPCALHHGRIRRAAKSGGAHAATSSIRSGA